MKKVRGEVNPADIFTKHLPSREKVHQLLNLFGCEYRDGRAASAPLLRPHGFDDREGGHSGSDPLPTFVTDVDAQPHDIDTLPHMYPSLEIERMFPTIRATNGPANADDYNPEAKLVANKASSDGCRLRTAADRSDAHARAAGDGGRSLRRAVAEPARG